MTLRSKYNWYLFVIGLLCTFSLNAQYSEQDLKREADQLFQQRAYVDAMPLYSQLLSLNPTNPTYNFKYGASALFGGAENKKESIKFLRFASQNSGVDNEVWYYLGRAYHLNYLFDDAIHAYGKYIESASSREVQEREVERRIESCRAGMGLLSHIKDITVLDKKSASIDEFFRLYDLSDIGGRILVTPDALLSNLDKRNNHRSLIHYRGTGTTVYFSSYGRDGKNGLDIYRAEVLPDGEFSQPVALSSTINSPYDEDFPYMHPDGKTLYFSSKGHGSMGGYDIFQSDLNPGTGLFSTPQNLDFAVNTPDDDLFYVVDSLNNLANFSSSRSSALGNLHVYRVEVQSAPMELTFVKGDFVNRINPEIKTTKITVADATTNEELEVQYSDPNTGEYLLNFPKGGRYKFSVEVSGSDRVHVGIVDIPSSSGVNAYMQEMELVSLGGTEKLSINNRFDLTFDGDIAALAQELLRQKAQLDVNFHRREIPVDDAPLADADPGQERMERAYNDAGFGAGMSNQAVVEQAEEREAVLESRVSTLDEFASKAAERSAGRLQDARELLERADELTRMARQGETGDPHAAMFNAGVARHRAKMALSESRNAEELRQHLENEKSAVEADLDDRRKRTETLRSAIESGNYNDALDALVLEKQYRENRDPVTDRFDPVRNLREESIEARNTAQNALDRASALRNVANRQDEALSNAIRRRENAQPGEYAQLDAEVTRQSGETEAARRRTANAFAQAEALMKTADDGNTRYEMLEEFRNSEEEATYDPDAEVWSAETAMQLDAELDEVDIDADMVATYLQNNPEAATQEFGDVLAVEFRKAFAGHSEVESALAFQSTGQQSESQGVQNDAQGDEETASAHTRETQVGELGEIAETDGLGDAPTGSIPQTRDLSDAGSTVESDLSQSAVNSDVDEMDGTRTANEPRVEDSAEPGTNTAMREGNEEVFEGVAETVASTDEPSDTSVPQIAERDADAHISEEELPEEVTENNENTVASPAARSARIETENAKIAAAEDWISIIDESIADLRSGMQDGDSAEIAEQLAQYATLREDRLAEIEESRERIVRWEAEEEAMLAAALKPAFDDVDTLSVSLVSRLEMKIPEMAEDMSIMRDLREIDRDFLAELAAIELSGLSKPEIAQQRIQINQTLIANLNERIQTGGTADLPVERLLELRRMLALGVLNDREVQMGRAAYNPRTPEAREYAVLISGDEATETADAPQEVPAAETSGKLSPEMEAELNRPYSRTGVLPEYEAEVERISQLEDELERYSQTARLNQNFLEALGSEIQLYKLGMDADDDPDPRLKARYDLLLQERFQVVNELQEVSLQIDDARTRGEDIGSDHLAETTAKTDRQTDRPESPNAEESQGTLPSAEAGEVRGLDYFKDTYVAQKQDIESGDLPASERLDALANLNSRMALSIDREVERMVDLLDDPYADVDRDSLQILISELDALAADKRQRADNYRSEIEMKNLAMVESEGLESETQKPDFGVSAEGKEEFSAVSSSSEVSLDSVSTEMANMHVEVAEGIQIHDIHYKSLNANIRRGTLDGRLETAEELQQSIAEDRANLESAEPHSRDSLLRSISEKNQRLVDLNEEILAGLEASNAEEVAYYQAENKRLLAQIPDGTDGVDGLKHRENQSKIDNRISELDKDFEIAEMSPIERRDKVTRDLALIEELSAFNEALRVETEELQIIANREATALLPSKNAAPELAERSALLLMTRDSAAYEPIPERTYITPIHQSFDQYLSEDERKMLIAEEPGLDIDLSFADDANREAEEDLLISKSHVDRMGIRLLSETPVQFSYLTSAVRADSLKELELQAARSAKTWTNMARERLDEIDRLNAAAQGLEKDRDKMDILRRVERLEDETEVLFQKSTIAAIQAEELRMARRANEEDFALAALQLTHSERKALDDLLEGNSYAVVSPNEMDGRPAEKSAEWIVGGGVDVSPPAVEKDVDVATPVGFVDGGEPDVPKRAGLDEAEVPADPEVAEMPYEPVFGDASAVNFIPEDLYRQTGGNWLGIVDIIAEKVDFSDVSETMFVETGKPDAYSDENPIPMDPAMPDGLIFQVQVGAYRNAIPQDLFGEFAPVMGQEIGDGITRYRAGLFTLYNQAATARDQIRAKGYSDAFVVAFLDGERLTGEDARNLLAQARTEENVETEATAATQPALPVNQAGEGELVIPDYYDDPDAAEASKVEVIKGLFFTVQVGVYSKPVKLDQLYNLDNLNTELTGGGLIRYTTGRFASIEAANPKKMEARAKGVDDAFVTAYLNGVRISVDSARAVLEIEGENVLAEELKPNTREAPSVEEPRSNKGEHQRKKEEEGRYVVIMGRFSADVPQELANLFLERPELNIRRIEGPGGGAIYVTSELSSREDALEILRISRNAGVNSAVIGRMVDGEIKELVSD